MGQNSFTSTFPQEPAPPWSPEPDITLTPLLEARMELLDLARPSYAYCAENGIDWSTTQAVTGGVFLAPIRPIAPRSFAFYPMGRLAAVAEVLAEDGETVIDIVGWSTSDPRRFGTMFGRAPALGMAVAVNPGTYFLDQPLRLFRTPLAWLQAGCDGSVLLDQERSTWWLMQLAASKFGAEDDEHAADLEAARTALFDEQSFLVPARVRTERRRAA